MPSDSTLILGIGTFPVEWVSALFFIFFFFFFLFHCYLEIPVFNANSVDTAQTLSSVASGLCLRLLPMSFLWDAKYELVNTIALFLFLFFFFLFFVLAVYYLRNRIALAVNC